MEKHPAGDELPINTDPFQGTVGIHGIPDGTRLLLHGRKRPFGWNLKKRIRYPLAESKRIEPGLVNLPAPDDGTVGVALQARVKGRLVVHNRHQHRPKVYQGVGTVDREDTFLVIVVMPQADSETFLVVIDGKVETGAVVVTESAHIAPAGTLIPKPWQLLQLAVRNR